MSRFASIAIAAAGLMFAATSAVAAPLGSALGASNATGIADPVHFKPGNHCHSHGHGKLCHGPNDYPALYPRADRKPHATHRHTRLCRH